MFGSAPSQHPPRHGAGGGAHSLDKGSLDHGDRDTGEPLAQDDIVFMRVDDGLLVRLPRAALRCGDEAGSHLDALIPETHRGRKVALRGNPARANEWDAQVA